jgi:CAP-Gly domain-containing linker protein 1
LNQVKEELETKTSYYESVIAELHQKIAEYESMLYVTEEQENESIAQLAQVVEQPVKLKAPRLFCDICDEFDLHDTEDCPKQAMTEKEQAAHSMHNAKKSTRSYCDDW